MIEDIPDEATSDESRSGPRILLWQWLIICTAVFLVRILPWAISELWHDEVITLGDFVIGPSGGSWLHVFRSYPVANNHILFSAVAWWWVRFTGFASAEYMLRLPSIVFGLLSLWLVTLLWRRWLGTGMAFLVGGTVAISPVFGAFAYQLRGYSLTMLLSVPAVTGLAWTLRGDCRRGLWMQVPCLALLPLVIPSNVLLAVAHALFIVLWNSGERSLRQRLGLAAVVGGAGAIGLAYYLTIWQQFMQVLQQTAGWQSGFAVVGNLGLGMVAHGGLISLFSVAAWRRSESSEKAVDRRWSIWYVASIGVVIAASLIAGMGSVPFPRTFLVFLLPLTFALAMPTRHLKIWRRYPLLVWAGLTLVLGFAWERGASMMTDRALDDGRYPQNLLQQYYRGRTDLRSLATRLAAEYAANPGMIVTNAYDFPTFRFYWTQEGLPADAITAVNRNPEQLWKSFDALPGARLYVVAPNEIDAAKAFSKIVGSASFKEVVAEDPSSLYVHLDTTRDRLPKPGRRR